jgi:hypothetical protein
MEELLEASRTTDVHEPIEDEMRNSMGEKIKALNKHKIKKCWNIVTRLDELI